MPGSPPISTVEPRTKPPPSARSNSTLPLDKRVTVAMSISSNLRATVTAAPNSAETRRRRRTRQRLLGKRVPRAAQSPHCPDHFGAVEPQSVQR